MTNYNKAEWIVEAHVVSAIVTLLKILHALQNCPQVMPLWLHLVHLSARETKTYIQVLEYIVVKMTSS